MLKDSQGLTVTTSPEAVDAIDCFTEQLLGYGNNLEVILNGVEVDPSGVLVNAHAAALNLFLVLSDFVEGAESHSL